MLISIIVPCFQERNYIEAMVDSVARQTMNATNFELIVIDGGSNDGTLEVLQKLAEKYCFLKLLHNPHKTAPYALNLGIKHAKGQYIARMDVHAKYPDSYLETLYAAARVTGADNVGCCMDTLPGDNSEAAQAIALALSHPFGVGNSYFRIGIKNNKEVDTVPFGFYKRDLFDQVGLFDTEMPCGEDDEFNARITQAGKKILLIPADHIQYFARESYGKLARMMYNYGFFRPIANTKLKRPANIRQFAPLILVLLLSLSLLLSPFMPVFFYLFISLITVYLLGNSLSAFHVLKKESGSSSLSLWFKVIAGFVTCHFSYGYGYLRGLLSLVGKRDTSGYAITASR